MTSDLRSITSDTSLSGVPNRSADGRRPGIAFDTHLARLAPNNASNSTSSSQTARPEVTQKDSSDRQSRADRIKKTNGANVKDASQRRSEDMPQSQDDKVISGRQDDSSTAASALNNTDDTTASDSSTADVEDVSSQKDKSDKDADKQSAGDGQSYGDAATAQVVAAQSQLPPSPDDSGASAGLAGNEIAADKGTTAVEVKTLSEASNGLHTASPGSGGNSAGSTSASAQNSTEPNLPGALNTQTGALTGDQAAHDAEASAAQQARTSQGTQAVQADANSGGGAQAESSSQQSSFDGQPSDEKPGHSPVPGSGEAALMAQLQSVDPTGSAAVLAHSGGVSGSVSGGTPAQAAAPAAQPQPSPEAAFSQVNHPSIVKAIHGQLLPQGGSMHLRLDPPELGALQVSVHMRDGMMTASFQTSNDQASQLLSHSLSQLKHALEAQGVSVQKIHVEQASPGHEQDASSNGQSHQNHRQSGSEQSRQQRRELLQQMWRRLAIGNDPLDMVA